MVNLRHAAILVMAVVSTWVTTLANTPLAVAVDRFSRPISLLEAQQPEVRFRVLDGGEKTPSDVVVVSNGNVPKPWRETLLDSHMTAIRGEGFALRWDRSGKTLFVLAIDSIGARYGLAEVIQHWHVHGTIDAVAEKTTNPELTYRILKFNLPWSPYRRHEAAYLHTETCRDLAFWERFLDMMVGNRFNVLSLWNNHPFPYMVRSASFPEATPFSDAELAEWQAFWTALFRMAKDRGIQTFVVNWNIVVSPEFASAYGASEYSDRSAQVEDYTRESVKQVIDEYPDLTGIGVTLADWMGNFPDSMTPQEREDWIDRVYIRAMQEASRPVKFLHRSVLAGDPLAMRQLLDNAGLSEPALVEIKFNWSHGHSTPHLAITHDFHSGELDSRFWEPLPESYRIQWMVRNEDFFTLRWGQPDFIRAHLRENAHDAVNGYFVGSEGYIPAVDYASRPGIARNWQYAFERQWMFYLLWGQLLYDPDANDDIFEDAIALRFGREVAGDLYAAYRLASQMPLRLASFYRSTWDYTLYSEGFMAPEPAHKDATFDRSSPFITINEFIDHETLDPRYVSIRDYVTARLSGQSLGDSVTPLQLADQSTADSREALKHLQALRLHAQAGSGGLNAELDDLATWAYLGLYMADKIRAGVHLQTYRQTGDTNQQQEAISLLTKCLAHWDSVIVHTEQRYQPMPHVANEYYKEGFDSFSWAQLRTEVVRDIELARQTPGWWTANNLRVIQTNLPDFVAAEIQPDTFVSDLVDMGANTLIINVGGIMAFYPTQLDYHYRNPHADSAMMGEIIRLCRLHDIRVMVRVDFSRLHKSIFEQYPDWCYQAVDGSRMVNDDIYVVAINAPYVQEKSFEIIQEIMDLYPIDGIFLNMPGYQTSNAYTGEYFGVDHNPYERERFAVFSGGLALPEKEDRQDSTYRTYLAYRQDVLDRWAQRLHDIVKSHSPQIAICTYTDKHVDIIRHESQRNADIPYWPHTAADNVANTTGTFPAHIVSNASIQQLSFRSRFNAVEPEEVRIRLYENIASGSGLDVSIMGQISGNPDARNFEVMRDIYQFHKANEAYYGRYQSTAKVAILSPGLWVHGDAAEEYRGLQLMLREAHVPFDVVGHYTLHRQGERLHQYQAIIVPGISQFAEQDLDVLRTLAASGTSILGTSRAFAAHPEFLETYFGATAVELDHDGTGNYLTVSPQGGFGGLPGQQMLSWQYQLGLYNFRGGQSLLPIMAKGRPGPPENVGGHDPIGHDAVGLMPQGTATHVLLPGQVGKLYYRNGYMQYRNLWLTLLQQAYPAVGDIIRTDAPAKVSMEWKAFHWNDGRVPADSPDGHILHLVNTSGFNGQTFFPPYTLGPIQIDVALNEAPARLYTLKGKEEIPFSWLDGRLSFDVPVLTDYEAVVAVSTEAQ